LLHELACRLPDQSGVADRCGGFGRISGFAACGRKPRDQLCALALAEVDPVWWAWARRHPDLIIPLAARHRLSAVYASRYFVTAGGLISYGPDLVDQYRRAAGYVDRILKARSRPQAPTNLPDAGQFGGRFGMIVGNQCCPAATTNQNRSVVQRSSRFRYGNRPALAGNCISGAGPCDGW
jgi:hypothetical protein